MIDILFFKTIYQSLITNHNLYRRNNVKITNKFNPKSVFFISFYEWLHSSMDRIFKFVDSKVHGEW